MTVYIDLIFFENVILNFIILLATALISKSKIKFWRLLLSSIIGSVYAILEYIIVLNKLQSIFFKLIISIMMVLIAFKKTKIKMFLKNIGAFYLTSFTFGGTAFMFLFFIKPQNLIFESGHFTGVYPIKMAVLGGIFGFFFVVGVQKILKRKFIKVCDIEIVYKGKVVKTKALMDTR